MKKIISALGNEKGGRATAFILGYKNACQGITMTGGSPCFCAEMKLSALAVDFDAAALSWMR